MATDPTADGEKAYRDAMARLRFVKAEWTKRGRPLTTAGSMGQERPHPLWSMLQDAEMTAAKLRVEVRKRHSGPDPRAVVRASIGQSPAAKIRRVK